MTQWAFVCCRASLHEVKSDLYTSLAPGSFWIELLLLLPFLLFEVEAEEEEGTSAFVLGARSVFFLAGAAAKPRRRAN